MVVSNRNLLFQGSIFRCHVSFREGVVVCSIPILFSAKDDRPPENLSRKTPRSNVLPHGVSAQKPLGSVKTVPVFSRISRTL